MNVLENAEAPGRLEIDSFVTQVRQVPKKDFVARNPHPFLLQLTESTAEQPVWQTATVKLAGGEAARAARPLFVYPITKRPGANPFGFVTLGRALNNDIVLPYPSISKFHASLRSLGGKWSLTDADTVNGTSLDGSRLAPERSFPIHSGMVIEVGVAIQLLFLGPAETWDHMKLV